MSEILYKRIKDFNVNHSHVYEEIFSKLADGQKPDALFIGCSDSRVMPNLFSKSDPGELFMLRNVGNLVPAADKDGNSLTDESEASALEYSLHHLLIDDIIVCGHSSCGAMGALVNGRNNIHSPNLKNWLRHGDRAPEYFQHLIFDENLSAVDRYSQANVLLQLEHVKTYPIVISKLATNELRLHAWWIDIKTSKVYQYDETAKKFQLIV